MEGYAGVFEALKNGVLMEELAGFENEQLRPFLPVLMLSAFPNDASAEDNLDLLRSRLIDIHAGNQFLQYMKLDFASIDSKCQEAWRSQAFAHRPNNFMQLSCVDKVTAVCTYLISKMHKYAPSNAADAFDPFDIEHCQEEAVWIMTLAALHMPDIFALSKFANVLLSYTSGPKLLSMAVLNQPDAYDSVLRGICSLSCPDEDGFLMHQRSEAVKLLLQLDRAEALALLNRAVAAEKLYPLAVDILCCDTVDDLYFVDFLVSQLMSAGHSFGAYIVKSTHRQYLKKFCDRLGRILIRTKKAENEANERIVLLMALLSSYPSFKQTSGECLEWLQFLTSQTTNKSSLLQTSLAALLSCPNLIQGQTSVLDERADQCVTEFFRWIRDLASSSDEQYAALSQFMLLIAIHMNATRSDELANLLSSVLGFKVPDTLRKISGLKALYLRHALTERDVAEKAARIGVTKDLTAHTGGYLPAHCINHLLASRTFSRYKAPVQNWIKAQLSECRAPVHSIMPSLLENFAESCIPKNDQSTFNSAIDEDYFWELFSGDPFDASKLVLRVLAFHYLLLYTHKLDNTAIPPALYGTKRAPAAYTQRLWALIPVRFLLIAIDARHADFQHLRPTLLKVVGQIMPHMLPTIGSVQDRTDTETIQIKSLTVKPVPVEALQAALREYPPDVSKLMNLLSRLECSPITEQYRHYETIVEAMTMSLDEKTPRPLSEKVSLIWRRLENLIPRRLYEMTLQQWLNTINAATTGLVHVNDNFLVSEAPLVLFRVDERVLRSPPHFRCLMHMVSFYLEASYNANQIRLTKSHFQQPPPSKPEIDERRQLLNSYVGTQHLAVVQILLEICDGDPNERPDLEEIRKIACDQIHQMFIADATLSKLVHFHTYPLRLIPVMVKGVPSAHVLIGFIGELLASPDLQRRIFAVVLMVELWEQYKIPQAFAGLDLVSDVLSALICYNNDESAIALFLNVVPVLGRLVRLSPYHSDAVASVLQKIRRIAQSRLAVYASVTVARASPEWKLKQSVDLAMKAVRV